MFAYSSDIEGGTSWPVEATRRMNRMYLWISGIGKDYLLLAARCWGDGLPCSMSRRATILRACCPRWLTPPAPI